MADLPPPLVPIARRFQEFADLECREESPLYFFLCAAIAEDTAILDLLTRVPRPQPILFFATARFLGAPSEPYEAFRAFVLDRASEVLGVMRARGTQTNEVGRCAVLLPILAALPQPLALLEVGASAGLCLLLDRYAYEYEVGGSGPESGSVREKRVTLGEGPVRLRCAARGPVPIPERLPEVVWRRGVDLAPVDVMDPDAVRWLEAFVWPGQPERIERLRAAIAVARVAPPEVVKGDAIADLGRVAAEAPRQATLVIFHSAAVSYLDAEGRQAFADAARATGAVWLANEGLGVVHAGPPVRPPGVCFVLSRNDEMLALAHPHGRWLEWAQRDGRTEIWTER